MPRLPRLDLVGVPQHVVQRGNDRQPCYFDAADYVRYRDELREAMLRHECAIHAYVFMTNHVHLLVTPARRGAVSRLMQTLGRRYVRYLNDRHGRTGTLWEGRFKSCLVDSERYLLACHRYIELNPVRAGMVDDPGQYRWSSYGANAEGHDDPLVRAHGSYLALGDTAIARAARYRAWFRETIDPDEWASIRVYTQRQQALGSSRFQDAIEAMLERRVRPGKVGRPRRRDGAGSAARERDKTVL